MLPGSLLAVGSSSPACPWNPTVDPPARHRSQVSIAQTTTQPHMQFFSFFFFFCTKAKKERGRSTGVGLKKVYQNSTVLPNVLFLLTATVWRRGLQARKSRLLPLCIPVFTFLVVNQLVSLTALFLTLSPFASLRVWRRVHLICPIFFFPSPPGVLCGGLKKARRHTLPSLASSSP